MRLGCPYPDDRRILRDFPTDTLGHVRPVLEALSSSSLFVVLGAGVQIPTLPTAVQMPRVLRRKYHQLVPWYPVGDVPQSSLRSRLWVTSPYNPNLADQPSSSLEEREERRQNPGLAGVPDTETSALFRHILDLAREALPPVNHQGFYYVPSPAFIFDFNCDGLVRTYCAPPHIVVNPHGYIDRIWQSPESANLFHQYAARGGRLPNSKKLIEPGPEPKTITQTCGYDAAARYLSLGGQFLLLIGYSFGLQPDGSIDDVESFEFLCEHLRRFARRIVVADPHPEHVAGLFEKALGQRIHSCKVFWNHFAKAACLAVERSPGTPNLLALQDCIRHLYNGLAIGLVSEISG
jgi:hypothetical protein